MSDFVRDARHIADVKDKTQIPTADIKAAIVALKNLRVFDADLRRLRELRLELKSRKDAST
jgi:hypothetical protein